MVEEGYKRKLTAILGADVKGYSRLMDDDEEATLRTLTSHRTAFKNLVEEYRGRVVSTPGDYVLAEFSSVVDSVNCAVEIQRELAERNAELPDNRKMEFRIGINLGDVIEEDGQIYGDGVNIAARMEPLADAGGICISGRVYDQVVNKLGLEYEYLGEHEVKNISTPIRVYKVLSYPGEAAHRVVAAKETSEIQMKKILAISIASVLLIVAVIIGVWMFYDETSAIEPASIEKMVYPLPQKPSIVVMPFVNLSENPAMDKVVDGITGNIVTLLSKVPQLFVISSKSSFAYKDKQVTVQQIAEDLGVRYVLEGSVHKENDKVQVSVKLVDAVKGHHLWSERYDRQFDDVFGIQDEIALNVCSNLRVLLKEGEQARVVRGMTKSVEAFEMYLQADVQRQLWSKEGVAKARDLLKQALDIDPEYVDALHMLVGTHLIDARFGYGESREGSLQAAEDATNRILALDDTDSGAYGGLGQIHLWRGEHDKSIIARKKGYSLNPNNSGNIAGLAWAMFASGEPEEALVLIKEAMRLNPSFPDWWLMIMEESYRLSGRYDEAIETIHEELRRLDQYFTRTRLALYYAQTGRDEEARAEIVKVLQLNPDMDLEIWEKAQFFKNKDWLERDLADLRRVGLPEKALQTPSSDKEN